MDVRWFGLNRGSKNEVDEKKEEGRRMEVKVEDRWRTACLG